MVHHVLTTGAYFNGQFKGQPRNRRKQSQWPRLASPDAELTPPLLGGARRRTLDWEARRCARIVSGTSVPAHAAALAQRARAVEPAMVFGRHREVTAAAIPPDSATPYGCHPC
jgi:hypothetical protein